MDAFTQQPLLTCIGNKRKLIPQIIEVIRTVAKRLGKDRLRLVDACTGSGVVARHILPLAEVLYVNDLEEYAYVMARSVFEQPSPEQREALRHHFQAMKELIATGTYTEGVITYHYAPACTSSIQINERCFYTHENALIIDTLRSYITQQVSPELQHWCFAPLLVKASIHTNTSGVFKGFHKSEGIGCFGGKKGDALGRIMKPIAIELPIWSEEVVPVHCSQLDVVDLLSTLPDNLDLIYLDPPYVSAPYGSNYFMLNLILQGNMPSKVSKVSGIPSDWKRSAFNYHASAITAMTELLARTAKKAKYLLISYNNEGLITPDEWRELFASYEVEVHTIEYEAYKGSRNYINRNTKVLELLYLVKFPSQ